MLFARGNRATCARLSTGHAKTGSTRTHAPQAGTEWRERQQRDKKTIKGKYPPPRFLVGNMVGWFVLLAAASGCPPLRLLRARQKTNCGRHARHKGLCGRTAAVADELFGPDCLPLASLRLVEASQHGALEHAWPATCGEP